jgi:hypothetical protein
MVRDQGKLSLEQQCMGQIDERDEAPWGRRPSLYWCFLIKLLHVDSKRVILPTDWVILPSASHQPTIPMVRKQQ